MNFACANASAAKPLAGGMDFPATVAPFILRGITLYGIDSVMAPQNVRQQAWNNLEQDLDLAKLEAITTEISLAETPAYAEKLLAGEIRGRVAVRLHNDA